MKQGQCVQAYKALSKIMGQDTSLQISKKVFDMHAKLQPIWDFQINEEMKIAGRHPDVDPVTASVKYKTDDKEAEKTALAELAAFEKELTDLADLEPFLEKVEPFTIYMDQENIRISGNDIKALSGFVNFE